MHHLPQMSQKEMFGLIFEVTASQDVGVVHQLVKFLVGPPLGQHKGELSLQGSKPGRVKVQALAFVSANFKVLALTADTAGKVANAFSGKRMKSAGNKMDNSCGLFAFDIDDSAQG